MAQKPDTVGDEGESFEEALAKLTPEQTEMFMQALDMTMRKRRLMLLGNLLALLCMVGGMLLAFIAFSKREPGTFTGWVFLVPFASAGMCMWFFGRLARTVRSRPLKSTASDD